MELASMLAGEPFSDHPRSVCPVIAAFLRAYNDAIDDERRQDLYAYAVKVVGSRGSEQLANDRANRLRMWTRRRRRIAGWEVSASPPGSEAFLGTEAVHSIRRHDDRSHIAVVALIDELLAMGDPGNQTPTATGLLGGLTWNGRSWSSPMPTTP
jgi:hypothetical protein